MSTSYAPTAALPAHAFVADTEARNTKRHYQQLQNVLNRMLNYLEVPDKAARGILGIQGVLNGREKFPALIAHKYVARQLNFTGKEENSDTYMCRVLTAISDAEEKCGRKFFDIKRADGVTLIITSYEKDFIGEAALWALTEARKSDEWRKNPAKAVTDELIAAACEKLPVCVARERSHDPDAPSITDERIIKGMRTRMENIAEATLARVVAAGGDPVREARRMQDRIMRLAISARKLMLQRDSDSGERRHDGEEEEGYGYNMSDKNPSDYNSADSFDLPEDDDFNRPAAPQTPPQTDPPPRLSKLLTRRK